MDEQDLLKFESWYGRHREALRLLMEEYSPEEVQKETACAAYKCGWQEGYLQALKEYQTAARHEGRK
jgi:hypothetical protein